MIKSIAHDPNPQAIALHGNTGFFLVSRFPVEANSVSRGQNGRNEAAVDSERDTGQRRWQYAHNFGSHPVLSFPLAEVLTSALHWHQ